MNRDYFWLTEDQFARLEPLLPTDTRGKPRLDDRRVISGIVHVLKSGGRWVDAPSIYGPHKTLYNRFADGLPKVFGSTSSMPWPQLVNHRHRF
jgi:transposase